MHQEDLNSCGPRVMMDVRITFPSRVLFVTCVAGVMLALLAARGVCQDPPADIFLNDPTNATGNMSSACITQPSHLPCPDPRLRFFLYAGPYAASEEINVTDPMWFTNSTFDPDLPTVVLVHGYRGGDSIGPMVLLKNEYIRRGEHNLIVVDWGEYTRPPCYMQAIISIQGTAKCTAEVFTVLQSSGFDAENITCVGHSLGAHLCGKIGNFWPLKRIIGLDPARPLFFGNPATQLDSTDAPVVQVIHTNTGFYGMPNMIGTADMCVNKGQQPFCVRTRNRELCSHAHALCFMAESLNSEKARMASPCAPMCPQPSDRDTRIQGGILTPMGNFMDDSARGMYCVDSDTPPFCRTHENDTYGDIRCCPVNRLRTQVDSTDENSLPVDDL